jgi:hypothetical protein
VNETVGYAQVADMETLFGSSGSPSPDNPPPAASTGTPAAPLQFDRAEPINAAGTAVTCQACDKQVDGVYYVVNGLNYCRPCKEEIEQRPLPKPGPKAIARGALYGLGAALLGTIIYYAVLALSGYEIGWIAVIVGWLVGKAVHKGAYGLGGRKLQLVAVALTYSSIVASYIPLVVREAIAQSDEKKKKEAAQSTKGAPAGTSATQSASEQSEPAASFMSALLGLIVAVGLLFLFALAMPFVAGFSNILGLFIIFLGLLEAWKLNKAPELHIAGPFDAPASTSA